jgi:hypothetical protein
MTEAQGSKKMDFKAAADLDNEKRAHVLEIIDKLHDLGIGETVSLPQVRDTSRRNWQEYTNRV